MQTGQVQRVEPDVAVLGKLEDHEITTSFNAASKEAFGRQQVTTFSSRLHLQHSEWRAVFELLWRFIVVYAFMVLSVRFSSFATNCLLALGYALIKALGLLRKCVATLAQAAYQEAESDASPSSSAPQEVQPQVSSESKWTFGYGFVSITLPDLPDWQALFGHEKRPESGPLKTNEQQQTNVTTVIIWCGFKLVLILVLAFTIVWLIKKICTCIGLDKAVAWMLNSISGCKRAQKVQEIGQKIGCPSQVHRLLGTVWGFIQGSLTLNPFQILFEQIARVCSAETITSNNRDPVSEETLTSRIPQYVYYAYRSWVRKALSPDAIQVVYCVTDATRKCLENWHYNTNEANMLYPLQTFFAGVQDLRSSTFDRLFQPNFDSHHSEFREIIRACLPGFVEGMCPRLSSGEFQKFEPSRQVKRRSAQSKEACENANSMIHKVTKWCVPLVTILLLVILFSFVYYLCSFLGGFGLVSNYMKVFTSAISNTTRVTNVTWTVHGNKIEPQARAFAEYVVSPAVSSPMICLHTDYQSNQNIHPDEFEVHKYMNASFLAKSKEIRTFYSTQANVSETCQNQQQTNEMHRSKRSYWRSILIFFECVSEDFPDIICNDIPLPDKLTMDKFNVDCFQSESIEFQGFEILGGYMLADAPDVLNLLIGLCTEVGLWSPIVGITIFVCYAIQYCLILAHKICVCALYYLTLYYLTRQC